MALLFCAHYLLPKSQAYTSKFFTLQYHNDRTTRYGAGFDDIYYVFLVVVALTGLRAAAMEYVLAPYAKHMGLLKKKEVTRFSEQAWLVIYCSIFWTLGFVCTPLRLLHHARLIGPSRGVSSVYTANSTHLQYLYYNSPAWLNLRNLWAFWPNRELGALHKFYILTQLGFWFQQVFVINIEERRKDHWQMLAHHFVTIALIVGSYRYHHNAVGNLILVLFDVGDILLSVCIRHIVTAMMSPG